MIGQALAHYRITAAIGAGGMGEVYRATDTKLGRDVALKVLPPEMASDLERVARFQREARAVAALNHPGIVTIHSVEQEEGIHFLTMEIVEGQSLDKLVPEGGLEAERLLGLAVPLLEAVAVAHDRGITHRDLKPANVMVTDDGRVKVLDFGLAKIQTTEDDATMSHLSTQMQTREGVIAGTVPYMSPEQLEGRRVDQRTDVFSLGVILYELATGRRPFHSDSTAGLMSAILRDEPPAPKSLRASLPVKLESVIVRCLAKDPAARYQGAGEVKAALECRPVTDSRIETAVADSLARGPAERADSGTSRADTPWMVVLPFKAQGSDPDLAAFADGLGEDITTGLSRFSHLFVVSRNSAARYAEGSPDVRTVGRELGARYALEGAVRKAGSAVRVSAQLLDATTGTHLWAETYDRDLAEAGIFEVQDDITDRVVATVADPYGVLVRSMALTVRDGPLDELSEKELVLRFCAYWHQIRPEEHARLREALERRLEAEPAQAEAWACLSRLYSNEHSFRLNPRPDSIERARKAAQRAVEIDPTSQASWEALAEASYFARDLGAFRNAAERAMALNPRNTSTMALMGVLISHGGEWDRGLEIMRRAMEINPHHEGWYHFPQFFDHYRKREFDEALLTTKRLNMPEDFWVHAVTAATCGRLGRKEEARTALESLRRLLPGYPDDLGPALGLWIADAAVVEQVMEGMAEAEALADERPRSATASASRTTSGSGRSARTTSARRALVVLPFVNMSDDRENEFFSDGVTEEILTMLSKVGGLHVISRTSAMAYKGTSKPIGAIARELEVDSVLEGSVRRAGNRVRVTAQLIEAASDRQLWSERYDRDLEDIFEVQSEVAVAIAAALESELGSDVAAQLRQRPTENIEAYDLYLQGRQGVRTLRAPEILRGIRQLEEAIALDSDFAQARAELALAHLRSAYWGAARGSDDFEDARHASTRALELDPSNAVARVARAGARCLGDFDWEGAVADLREAIRLDPNEVEAHHWLGMTLFLMGRFDEAVAAQKEAIALDPHSPNVSSHLGLAVCFGGRQEEGRRILLEGIEQHPVFFDFPNMLGMAHRRQERFDESASWYERTCELSGRHPIFEACRAASLRLAGSEDEADGIVARLREHEDDPRVDSVARALIAVAERDLERALRHFHEAADQRLPLVFWCLRAVVCERELPRSDPGVRALRHRLWPLEGGDTAPSSGEAPAPVDSLAGPQGDVPSIAVLPFANLSPDPDNQYFSDGLSEEIINALTRLPGLRVIARTSAFRFRGEHDLRKVGEALRVRTLLEGSVRKAGQRLRITAQLIDVADESHIWSERFDRELDDVFAIQDEISSAIVEKLHLSLGAGQPEKRERANLPAFEALLEGRHHFSQFTPEAAQRALACLERALSLEPDYPDALVLHAFYHLMRAYMFVDPREALPETRRLAERALTLDPHHGEAQATVAVAAVMLDWDWTTADRLFRRALELAPGSARVHELYGLCGLLGRGRLAEALAKLDRAVELDPLSALYAGNRGRVLTCSRRFAEAEESCRRGLALDPGQLLAQVELTYALTFQGRFEEAVTLGQRAVEAHGPTKAPLHALAVSLAVAGRREEAQQLLEKADGGPYQSPLTLGLVHAISGERDAAFEWVGRAIDHHDPMLMYLDVHPMFDALRDDPRYSELRQRVNLHQGDRV